MPSNLLYLKKTKLSPYAMSVLKAMADGALLYRHAKPMPASHESSFEWHWYLRKQNADGSMGEAVCLKQPHSMMGEMFRNNHVRLPTVFLIGDIMGIDVVCHDPIGINDIGLEALSKGYYRREIWEYTPDDDEYEYAY